MRALPVFCLRRRGGLIYNVRMAIKDNYLLAKSAADMLEKAMPIRLGVNKSNELVRLVYEISRREGVPAATVLEEAGVYLLDDPGGAFHRIKEALLGRRYPSRQDGDKVRIMPVKMGPGSKECSLWEGKLSPGKIFVEKSVLSFEWTRDFLRNFPNAEIREADSLGKAARMARLSGGIEEYNRRRETLFITANKAAFIKKCPCTRDARRCGYWVLNLGFGCPFDCSYCYLQTYNDIPGLVFTANIDDYYRHIMDFDAVAAKGLRIGTGEFTDSLALDAYTGYSRKLIGFFRNTRNLVLELKTKTAEIENVLKEEPHENVVISWSINTPSLAQAFEKGASGVRDRIEAARQAALKGYSVAFHFDPVIWREGWENEYRDITAELFSSREIREKAAWVSLGTLRYSPGLKQAAEQRFENNSMYYDGEFFLDFDGKFRYPESLRKNIYSKMRQFLREAGAKCWIYLCMEPSRLWED